MQQTITLVLLIIHFFVNYICVHIAIYITMVGYGFGIVHV